jgi:hypothetical protein
LGGRVQRQDRIIVTLPASEITDGVAENLVLPLVVAVSHAEIAVSRRDLIADTFDRQTGSNDLVTSRKSNGEE